MKRKKQKIPSALSMVGENWTISNELLSTLEECLSALWILLQEYRHRLLQVLHEEVHERK